MPGESLPIGIIGIEKNSHVAIIGGGPAGSFFGYFLLAMAERVGTDLFVDIYETRDFSSPSPGGCNMCGGIISESLVQTLATEGIDLPSSVVQRGIDSYLLHMDVGSVKIVTPLQEKRIGAVHRGAGPRGIAQADWKSFDGFLLKLALWDMFTGSAPYREVFMRMFHPFFWCRLLWSMAAEIWPFRRKRWVEGRS